MSDPQYLPATVETFRAWLTSKTDDVTIDTGALNDSPLVCYLREFGWTEIHVGFERYYGAIDQISFDRFLPEWAINYQSHLQGFVGRLNASQALWILDRSIREGLWVPAESNAAPPVSKTDLLQGTLREALPYLEMCQRHVEEPNPPLTTRERDELARILQELRDTIGEHLDD